MKIQQMYTGCLSEAAYYIESDGEAAVIDPLRETGPYIQRAKEGRAKIKYILETHFHADFVSGHLDLAKKTGATIVFGPDANPAFTAHVASDGEILKIGKITIEVLHTPGHTLESVTYLLRDENGKEHAIFTGDTLFIGDVGRPDLAIKSDMTQTDLAGMLYDSLRNKIMPLPDDVIVYPAHGAGSACGKNLSNETYSTLGEQKKNNYALGSISREDFIKELTTGILPPPQYFAKNAMMNKTGYDSIDEVITRGNRALSLDEFAQEMANGALILDVRSKDEFVKAHIPGSLFIGLDGTFAVWVGALITDLRQRIILIAPSGREEEAVLRLARVGYDHCAGYLSGGFDAWKNAGKITDSVDQVNATEFADIHSKETIKVVDVRKPGEYSAEHVDEAYSYPLDFILQNPDRLERNEKYFVHCKSGYRSVIAISLLKARGYNLLVDIAGGFEDIIKTNIPKSDFVCQTKL